MKKELKFKYKSGSTRSTMSNKENSTYLLAILFIRMMNVIYKNALIVDVD